MNKDAKIIYCAGIGYSIRIGDKYMTAPFKTALTNKELESVLFSYDLKNGSPAFYALNPENESDRVRITKENYKLSNDELFKKDTEISLTEETTYTPNVIIDEPEVFVDDTPEDEAVSTDEELEKDSLEIPEEEPVDTETEETDEEIDVFDAELIEEASENESQEIAEPVKEQQPKPQYNNYKHNNHKKKH